MRTQIIKAALNKLHIWLFVKVFSLNTNMRITQTNTDETQTFDEYLLKIGNRTGPIVKDGLICIPDDMIIYSNDNENPIETIIKMIYPNLQNNTTNTSFIVNRAILILLNDDIDKINAEVICEYPGKQKNYYSFNSVLNNVANLYPIDYLNSLTPQGLPSHNLILKVDSSIMLLRNLDPANSLCNRTRLTCYHLGSQIINTEIITDDYQGR